jgi:hypothetical protein
VLPFLFAAAARWTLITLDGRDCSRDLAPKKYTEITAELRVISPLHPSDGIFTQGVADLLAIHRLGPRITA